MAVTAEQAGLKICIDMVTNDEYIEGKKFRMAFIKVIGILKYPFRGRKMRLYNQWIKTIGLSTEDFPYERTSEDTIPEPGNNKIRSSIKAKLRPNAVNISFAVVIAMICIVLVVLIAQSC